MGAEAIIKIGFVAVTAGIVAGCLGAVVVAAFGWPFSLTLIFAGMGAGAAAVRATQRLKGEDEPTPGA